MIVRRKNTECEINKSTEIKLGGNEKGFVEFKLCLQFCEVKIKLAINLETNLPYAFVIKINHFSFFLINFQ